MNCHNHSAASRLDRAMWQIIVLGILLVGTWPLSACGGGYHKPMGGTMLGQSGPYGGTTQPMSHPRPNHR